MPRERYVLEVRPIFWLVGGGASGGWTSRELDMLDFCVSSLIKGCCKFPKILMGIAHAKSKRELFVMLGILIIGIGVFCTFLPRMLNEYLEFSYESQVEAAKKENNWFRVFLLSKAAVKRGYPLAQFYLGKCYHQGLGVETNLTEAVKWYRKAVAQGNAFAQINLGNCYARGEGVDKDEVEAVKLFHRAAEQGDAVAQAKLGACYLSGEGVDKDESTSAKWFQKSAEQGNAFAQSCLGLCYLHGLGVEKDMDKAIELFGKVGRKGDPKAIELLKGLGITMTPNGGERSTIGV